MRHALALILTCFATIASAGDPAFTAENTAYQTAGRAVLDMVNAQNVDLAQVQTLVLEMQKAAIPAAKAYVAKHPAGAKVIAKTIAAAVTVDASDAITGLGTMKDLSFDEITAQWHDCAIFTVAEVGIDMTAEANEGIKDPLHAIVHPVMVLRAATDQAAKAAKENLDRMKEEMTEGAEHQA